MRPLHVVGALAPLLFISVAATAQSRTSIDLRLGYAAPVAELAGTTLAAGPAFGGTVAFRIQPHLHLYAGWDWAHFSADQSFAGADVDLEETGYTLGFRFEHPLHDAGGLAIRLEAGATYKHVEVEDADGDPIVDSGHGTGFETALGLTMPLRGAWRLAPMLRYRSLSPSFESGGGTTSGDLRYLGLEIGFTRRF